MNKTKVRTGLVTSIVFGLILAASIVLNNPAAFAATIILGAYAIFFAFVL